MANSGGRQWEKVGAGFIAVAVDKEGINCVLFTVYFS